MSASLPLSAQVFAILSGLIEERTGIHYGPNELDIFSDRVSPRAIERGFDSLLDYYYCLRYDADAKSELEALVDSLVVNETYFFREIEALRAVVDLFIAPAIVVGRRPRVWCAACSTGEEPLTLAMLLEERDLLDAVKILATDISGRALTRAKEGLYGARSLRAVPEGVLGRWLVADGKCARPVPRLHEAIEWRRLNLLDSQTVTTLGEFDVILCRNALIYFRDQTIKSTIDVLTSALLPNGIVVVGASESLLRFGTSLTCEEHRGVFVYRKRAP
jgi:chemotaxis protein methyltransferase CheR